MLVTEFGRMLLSLALVLGLVWLIARVGRSRGGRTSGTRAGGRTGWGLARTGLGRAGAARAGRAGPGAPRLDRIEVLGRRSLGRHSSIAVVRVGARTMVVGQTPQHITLLAEHEDPALGLADEGMGMAGLTAGPVHNVVPEHDLAPGLAPGFGAGAPRAWDAFVDRLREMTVRH